MDDNWRYKTMMIDIFPHIIPPNYKKALYNKLPSNSFYRKLTDTYTTLVDLDTRFKVMDNYEGLVQVLTLGAPLIQDVVSSKDAVELAKMANDEMAELVARYPDRFISAVAALPLNDIEATLQEVDRAITELKFRGIQISSDVNGKPLDSIEFMPLYEKMAFYDLPIWIHPVKEYSVPDYPNEKFSKYGMFLIFGWPYQTTLAMTRLALSGIFDKYPHLKIITHHGGAMVPFFASRIEAANDSLRTVMQLGYESYLKKQPVDYYRMFYNDTAISGSTKGLMCAYSFFGAEHLLFGTDMPYDNERGYRLTRETIHSIEEMDISDFDKRKIFEDNARKLLLLPK
jgi:predicted TIM-barrel fold metal-dependent hydrolase